MIHIALPPARRKARIEIIPLIDVIFFLLATFVLVSMSMVKNQGVPIRLPVAATGMALDRSPELIDQGFGRQCSRQPPGGEYKSHYSKSDTRIPEFSPDRSFHG